MSLPDAPTIVALAGIVAALALASRQTVLMRLGSGQKVVYAVIWAVVIGLVAALAERTGG